MNKFCLLSLCNTISYGHTVRRRLKLLLALIICLFSFQTSAQDTTFYNAAGEKVLYGAPFSTYSITRSDKDGIHFTLRKYTYEGQLLQVQQFIKDSLGDIPDGRYALWFDNNQKQLEARYQGDKWHGELKSWWRNGKLKGMLNMIKAG